MRSLLKKSLLLFTVLLLLFSGFSKTEASGNMVLKDLNGSAVDISNQKGRPVILFFWASWCHFCREEMKMLNQNYSQIEKEGITVYAVNVGESADKVRRFFKDYQLNFKVLLDSDGELADKYKLIGVPTYIFLNKSGRVVLKENRLPSDYKSLLLK